MSVQICRSALPNRMTEMGIYRLEWRISRDDTKERSSFHVWWRQRYHTTTSIVNSFQHNTWTVLLTNKHNLMKMWRQWLRKQGQKPYIEEYVKTKTQSFHYKRLDSFVVWSWDPKTPATITHKVQVFTRSCLCKICYIRRPDTINNNVTW